MTDARSKRDLIWEEKRRKREERLMGNIVTIHPGD
jgi:hypothetical protein